jgi:membrane protein DedA with SNARE-associated domain
MNLWKFSLYTLLGCLPWTFGLAFLGYKLGGRWDEVEGVLRPVSWLVAVLVVAGMAWWAWRRIRYLRAHPLPPAEHPEGRAEENQPASR